jgi:hypothetical protein
MIVMVRKVPGWVLCRKSMDSSSESRNQVDSMPRRAVEFLLSVVAAGLAAWLAREPEDLRGLELWVAAITAGFTRLTINLGRAILATHCLRRIRDPAETDPLPP